MQEKKFKNPFLESIKEVYMYNIIFGSKIIYCSILYKEDHNLSLILIMIANFEKFLNSKIHLVSY